jgi:(1->4)-alpha-D-glucan 1-alpha-D-glucosylmutase
MYIRSFVDPDNRRPVDYEVRTNYLKKLQAQAKENRPGLLQDLLKNKADGRIKLLTVYTCLQLRNQYQSLFNEGSYIPLQVSGKHKEHIVAFARQKDGQTVIVAAPHFLTKVIDEKQLPIGEPVWADTAIELPRSVASGNWKEVFSEKMIEASGKLPAKDIFREFPVSLLIKA